MFKPVESNINFPEMEKKWLKIWEEKRIIKKYLKKNKDSDRRFSFQDGPITANNPMGVHHAWGRTYKDLWQKFHNLLGFKQRFRNGFDCQGLWVEVEVEKELGLRTKKDIENLVPGDPKASIAKFVDLCKQRVYKFSAIQTEQSKRLGYFMDWDNSYFTMSDENNYMIWHFLKVCHENGWIYKGKESVPWCPRCETAISQHEMLTEDYKELVHEAVYFKLKVKSEKLKVNEYLLVWTTTPWTIPANIAVAVDKDMEYALVETEEGKLWMAKERVEKVLKVEKVEKGNNDSGQARMTTKKQDRMTKNEVKVLKVVKGSELVGLKYEGAFDDLPAVTRTAEESPDKFHTVIATDPLILPISTTEGTGLVHTAVSAGSEDFKLGKKYKLPMIPVIADNADYLSGLGFLSGKNAKKHPEIILDYLTEKNLAYKIERYKHRYPACWRCKTELVWKVEDEWYIAMDCPSRKASDSKLNPQKLIANSQNLKIKTLRERMIDVAKKIKWMPEFGLDRELDWLKNMHDWLISKKNRYWGLALPIYECSKCDKFEIIGSKEELKKRSVTGWDQFESKSPHKPYIDDVTIKCSCGQEIKRINDVGNPWLDAGIVPYSTIAENNQGKPLYEVDRKKWQEWFPINFITESFPGQFKNWFYSMIAMSTVLENTNPFENVLGFATLTGEDGRPMHKSWGNAIEFNEGADKIGVDVMRWMYVRHNPADNLLFGYKKADEVRRQFYLMLWNIYKYFVEYANLDKFKFDKQNNDSVLRQAQDRMTEKENILDRWLVNRFIWLSQFAKKSLLEYNVKDAALEIEKFVSDLSTWYIRRSRDRVWVNSDDSNDKDQFYQALYLIMTDLMIILSPLMPFASEEIYTNLTDEESVHLSAWPEFPGIVIDENLIKDMDLVRKLVEVGHRVRKEAGLKVRQPLSKATIKIYKDNKFISSKNTETYKKLIADELNVKNVIIIQNQTEETEVIYDTAVTKELESEGRFRDLIRQIQSERKSLGLRPEEKINVTIPLSFKNMAEKIKKRVVANEINFGDSIKVSK